MKILLTGMLIGASLTGARSKTCYTPFPNACVKGSMIMVEELLGKQDLEKCKKVCSANKECKTVDYFTKLQFCELKKDTTIVEGCFGSASGQVDSYQKTPCVSVFTKVMKGRIDELGTSFAGKSGTVEIFDQFDAVYMDL